MTEAKFETVVTRAGELSAGDEIRFCDDWYRVLSWSSNSTPPSNGSVFPMAPAYMLDSSVTLVLSREVNEKAVKLIVDSYFQVTKKVPVPVNPACPFCLTVTDIEVISREGAGGGEDRWRLKCGNKNCRVKPTGRWYKSEGAAVNSWKPVNDNSILRWSGGIMW